MRIRYDWLHFLQFDHGCLCQTLLAKTAIKPFYLPSSVFPLSMQRPIKCSCDLRVPVPHWKKKTWNIKGKNISLWNVMASNMENVSPSKKEQNIKKSLLCLPGFHRRLQQARTSVSLPLKVSQVSWLLKCCWCWWLHMKCRKAGAFFPVIPCLIYLSLVCSIFARATSV